MPPHQRWLGIKGRVGGETQNIQENDFRYIDDIKQDELFSWNPAALLAKKGHGAEAAINRFMQLLLEEDFNDFDNVLEFKGLVLGIAEW